MPSGRFLPCCLPSPPCRLPSARLHTFGRTYSSNFSRESHTDECSAKWLERRPALARHRSLGLLRLPLSPRETRIIHDYDRYSHFCSGRPSMTTATARPAWLTSDRIAPVIVMFIGLFLVTYVFDAAFDRMGVNPAT